MPNLDAIPEIIFFLGTVVLVMVAIEIGFLLGGFFHRQSEDEKESPVSAIASTVLGLTAFILAFTFGIVSDRYDTRRELVREEAAAIRVAWLRAEFLPETDRAEAKGLIREYLDKQLAFVAAKSLEPQKVKDFFSESHRIQGRLWGMAVDNARKDMNSDVAALYIESINDVINVRAQRVAVGLQARIPPAIWWALFFLMTLGMGGIGYQTGIAGSKRSASRPFLALSFALVITLIATLDRPHTKLISVSQQSLIDLHSYMQADSK